MPSVIYEMGGVSADGYIAGPDAKFDWSMPDEELLVHPVAVGGGIPWRYRAVGTR